MPPTLNHKQRMTTLRVDACFATLAPQEIYGRAWNVCASVDRRGRLEDTRYLHQRLGREFGAYLQERPEWPLVAQTIRSYQRARRRATHPLRFKPRHRVKSAPLMDTVLDEILPQVKARGVRAADILSAKLLYRGDQVFARLVHAPEPRPRWAMLDRIKRLKHRSSAENVGVAVVPDGVDVVVTNQRKYNIPKCYHIAVEHVIAPGFAQEFYRRFVQPKAHTVALDLSMVSQLSPEMQRATRQLVRWNRSRKAEGAVVAGVASPIPGEVRSTLAHAKASGLTSRRLLRREVILACPHCGASLAVKLDPKSLSPAPGVAECVRCGAAPRVGLILAARASAYVQHDWTNWGA